MKLIMTCVLFCSCLCVAQFAAATDSLRVPEVVADARVSLENLETKGKAAHQGSTIDMYVTARSVQRSKNGKNYFYKFNRYGQLISLERIGGVERHFAYANPSTHTPQFAKTGKRPWVQLTRTPRIISSPQISDADDASLISQQMEMGNKADLSLEFQPTQYEAYKKDGEDDDYDDVDFDWIDDMFIIIGDVVPEDTGGGGSSDTSNGYCKTRHCSFPSLAACMADCDRVKDWGQAACGAFAATPPPPYGGVAAVFACQGLIISAYNNICKVGCEAGNR